MSNSLDPDQVRHSVGPDLVPNCLQKLSADDEAKSKFHVEDIYAITIQGFFSS